ncbi:peptidase [Desertihabitans aurantiacus]|uniref:peptidase n=1 Tax=Desertihabitans aurantiacus TaxID=2282477 RepID=UPI001E4A8C87|nr:peptidase [Desertihabitans aurantiacus]
MLEVDMEGYRAPAVEVSPLQSDGVLSGFLLSGRWPQDLVEWSKVLCLAVRVAAVPGLLPSSTVFRVCEDRVEEPPPEMVGLVVAEGTLVGEEALGPGCIEPPVPMGLLVLHPPSTTVPSVAEHEVASGCIFLPGLPYLGLDHRASWVESDAAGTVTRLVNRQDLDPYSDADTAALSVLLAA